MDVFRSVEIRNAFFVGAGLQVIKTRLNFTVSKFYFLVLIPLYFRRLIGLF
jgi:hypothetical protein